MKKHFARTERYDTFAAQIHAWRWSMRLFLRNLPTGNPQGSIRFRYSVVNTLEAQQLMHIHTPGSSEDMTRKLWSHNNNHGPINSAEYGSKSDGEDQATMSLGETARKRATKAKGGNGAIVGFALVVAAGFFSIPFVAHYTKVRG
ncbi:unnamed protein product [Phytophthora fragariaefolia]|uniref:Unnamed protein product n=1 Tax=Phytophthora fragariaefolia TaxID=1490495 RepID=A0A9W6XNR3_9STRA|nr:unnamed protein product [Phytophthora fragariaefolia]